MGGLEQSQYPPAGLVKPTRSLKQGKSDPPVNPELASCACTYERCSSCGGMLEININKEAMSLLF